MTVLDPSVAASPAHDTLTTTTTTTEVVVHSLQELQTLLTQPRSAGERLTVELEGPAAQQVFGQVRAQARRSGQGQEGGEEGHAAVGLADRQQGHPGVEADRHGEAGRSEHGPGPALRRYRREPGRTRRAGTGRARAEQERGREGDEGRVPRREDGEAGLLARQRRSRAPALAGRRRESSGLDSSGPRPGSRQSGRTGAGQAW